MQLTERVHLVASGMLGLNTTCEHDCNAYLVDGGRESALVDTGCGYDVSRLVEAIARCGFDAAWLAGILLTHKHADHAGGAAEVKRLSGAPVYATAETARAMADEASFNSGLERARRTGAYPPDYWFRATTVEHVVRSGDSIAVGDLSLEVVETPGHCDGHCAYVFAERDRTVLFSGDALLPGGQVVLQPIADCSIPATLASIEQLEATRPDVLLAGHLAPVLREGYRHIELALARMRAGKLPAQLAIPERT